MDEIVKSSSGELTAELTQYDEKMRLFMAKTPTICIGIDERKRVFKNIEDVINLLSGEVLHNSIYIGN